MDNQRNILLIGLVVIGFLLWQQWQADYGPKPAPVATTTTEQGSVTQESRPEDLPEATTSTSSSISQADNAPAQSRRVHIRTDVLDLEIDTKGGDLVHALLPTYPVSVDEPYNAFDLLNARPETRYVAQSGLIHDKVGGTDQSARAPSHHAIYTAEKNEFRLEEGKDTLVVPMIWTSPDGIRVTKEYTFTRGSFLIQVSHRIENLSDAPWIGRQYRQIRRTAAGVEGESQFIYTFTGAAYYDGKYEKLSFDDMKDENLGREIEGGWVAMLQHYFLSSWVSDSGQSEWYYTKAIPASMGSANEYLIGMRSAELSVAAGEVKTFNSRFYVGPKMQKDLETIYPGLELTTDYGIFTIFSQPLFWLLSLIHDWVGNWGWAIIIVTILIKLVFYRLSAASYRSMARMRAVQPKLVQLKETYGDDKQRMNQALMDLYKKEKINPLGGCLPILVQIPVFIAFYWMLLESVEMRQAPFIFWITDLSTKDPYFVLPIIMGASMIVQQKLNPAPLDPIQQKVMMILPVVFTVFFAFFPSGLVLYWVTNNLLSIAQQWYIMRNMEQAKT
jgi:YidC/Oxa1 family membrane protein insertase